MTRRARSTRCSWWRRKARRRRFAALREVVERAWAVLRALHRSRQPLLPHAGGGRAGVEDAADAGGAGLEAARHRAHRGLLAGGAGPLGAAVPHAAGPAAEGAAAGRDQRPWRRRTPGSRGLHGRAQRGGLRSRPEEEGTAFVADRAGAWREILCVQEERVVGNDNTVAWGGRRLQLPESRLRPHFVRAKVRVHEYPDGAVSVFLGPHRLARYTAGAGDRQPRPHPAWHRARSRQGRPGSGDARSRSARRPP